MSVIVNADPNIIFGNQFIEAVERIGVRVGRHVF